MQDIRLVLASSSPRRQALLKQIDLPFEIHPSHIDEPPHEDNNPAAYARELAHDKAAEVARDFPDRLVIGADTIVVVDEHVLGKPLDSKDAHRMLQKLSGRSHEVITAFSLISRRYDIDVTEHESTEVHFKVLEADEIEHYVASGAPMDKAGSYGIQDYSGVFVDRIHGCFYNVVGLPLTHFHTTLQSILNQHDLQIIS